MDDVELVDAFVNGACSGIADKVSVHGDVLSLDGWWQAAFRLEDDAFIVRDEPPPAPTVALKRLPDVLRHRGLRQIPGDHPLIQAVTYAELTVTGVAWTLWATHAERGEAALAQRAAPDAPTLQQPFADDLSTADSSSGAGLGGLDRGAPSVWDHPAAGDLSAEFAASLQDSFPTPVVLAVGLSDEAVDELRAVMPKCRVEAESLDGAVDTCAAVVPHLVVVEASTEAGRRFLLEFRAEACGRHVPVGAVIDGDAPAGADFPLDARQPPSAWQADLLERLP